MEEPINCTVPLKKRKKEPLDWGLGLRIKRTLASSYCFCRQKFFPVKFLVHIDQLSLPSLLCAFLVCPLLRERFSHRRFSLMPYADRKPLLFVTMITNNSTFFLKTLSNYCITQQSNQLAWICRYHNIFLVTTSVRLSCVIMQLWQ